MNLTKELVDRFFGVVSRGSMTDAKEWLLEVMGLSAKDAKKSASNAAAFSAVFDPFMPADRRHAAKDTRPLPQVERRVGAPDTRALVNPKTVAPAPVPAAPVQAVPIPNKSGLPRRHGAVDTRPEPRVDRRVGVADRRHGATDLRPVKVDRRAA